MELVALLSSGKGTWGQIAGLINRSEWDKITLVCTEFAKTKVGGFTFAKNAEIVSTDFDKPIKDIVDDLKTKLKDKIKGTEVALSIASGNGKEHTALISSLLNLPVGVKFVVLTKDGITYF
ncbi:MAG: hypothetical protein ABH817_01800 [archaeon]